jgi:hypothetical protein
MNLTQLIDNAVHDKVKELGLEQDVVVAVSLTFDNEPEKKLGFKNPSEKPASDKKKPQNQRFPQFQDLTWWFWKRTYTQATG